MAITGLKNITGAFAPREETRKVEWLKVEDGQSVRIRIMGEFDESSPNYDPARGLSVVKTTVTSPFNWKRTAEVATDGRDLPTEIYANRSIPWESRKGWRPVNRLYMNVLVNDEYVAVWQPNFTVTKALLDYITEIEADSVSNRVFVLKRSGSGKNTSYSFFQKGQEDVEPYDWGNFEPFDLSKIHEARPYEEQADFYDIPQDVLVEYGLVEAEPGHPFSDNLVGVVAGDDGDDLEW